MAGCKSHHFFFPPSKAFHASPCECHEVPNTGGATMKNSSPSRPDRYILTAFGFPYPVALTMIHMVFCSALAFAMVRVGFVEGINMSKETYVKKILPIAALFAIGPAILYGGYEPIRALQVIRPSIQTQHQMNCIIADNMPRNPGLLFRS